MPTPSSFITNSCEASFSHLPHWFFGLFAGAFAGAFSLPVFVVCFWLSPFSTLFVFFRFLYSPFGLIGFISFVWPATNRAAWRMMDEKCGFVLLWGCLCFCGLMWMKGTENVPNGKHHWHQHQNTNKTKYVQYKEGFDSWLFLQKVFWAIFIGPRKFAADL